MKYVFVLALTLALQGTAVAQHAHGQKGPSGGTMEDVAGVHAEFIASGNTVTVNILDENNKPIETKGFSGAALIVNGSDRETVTLVPTGTSLKGEAKKPLATGSSVVVTLKTASGKSGQARFKQ
jgi:hypothetical protein